MTDPVGNKPFAGIRILDFTRYLAGPFGTYQMALLGAEVIKIEPKSGDEMRLSSSVSPELSEQKLGPSFLGVNANKRSLALDLTRPKAVEIVKQLTAPYVLTKPVAPRPLRGAAAGALLGLVLGGLVVWLLARRRLAQIRG